MNIKNNQRYKNSSEKIETAFLALILNHKYEDIKISQICKKAEINRSTFYAHYDDINDLVVTIESRFANSMASIFDFGNRQENDAFLEMFEFVEKNKYFYKAFLNIPYTTVAEKNAKSQILENLNEKAVTADSIEIAYRATFFGAGIKEMCKLWLDRDCKETPEQMATLLKKEYTNRSSNDIFVK
ncbi:MAG: TetR/AcrR family transcriptional regulator [Clostridia bacterium]|nr:TetR/AcrR family transcriptional regulator [Clostridiales bacterium]MBQ7918171.1 TetR/AcrR family transcriptional regulator [Clostridia bacterium]